MAISPRFEREVLDHVLLERHDILEHNSRVLPDKVCVAVEDPLNNLVQLRLDILSMQQGSLHGVEIEGRHVLEILGWVGL